MTLMKKCHTIRPPNEQHATPILGSNSHEAADRQKRTHARTHARTHPAAAAAEPTHVLPAGLFTSVSMVFLTTELNGIRELPSLTIELSDG